MHDSLPLLSPTDFPVVHRSALDTVQVNVGYRCNLSCIHCHVAAGPRRTEEMDDETVALVLRYFEASSARTLDITGGAPEMNPHFRTMVTRVRQLGRQVIDRCNLTILEEPGYEDLAEFLAENRVQVVASLPCYEEENVARQRGDGVFDASIRGIRRLNALGYGADDDELRLDLVFNPQEASLPPDQGELEARYKAVLGERFGIRFGALLTLANMPVGRFGSVLISRREFQSYLDLLRAAHQPANLESVMCRSLVSIDWQGYVYDCDFNQMLGLPLRIDGPGGTHVSELLDVDLEGRAVAVRAHCYGCTAGQGSSCGGALA